MTKGSRYKFTGTADWIGNIIANGPMGKQRRYISIKDLRKLGFKQPSEGRVMTFEVYFNHNGPDFEDHDYPFLKMLNIRQMLVLYK